MKETEK
jgi:protein AATF/BFR2